MVEHHRKWIGLRICLGLALTLACAGPACARHTDRQAEQIRRDLAVFAEPSNVHVFHEWFVSSRKHEEASADLVKIGAPAIEPLLAKLSSSIPEQRYLIVRTLGKLRDRRAVPALIQAFETDEFHEVRAEAAQALTLLRDPRAVAPFLQAIRADLLEAPTYAIRALRVFPQPEVFEVLRVLLKYGGPRRQFGVYPGVIAGETLAALGRPGRELLFSAAADPNPLVRQHAASGLLALKDSRARPALLTLLQDPEAETRAFLAQELGFRKERRAVPVLLALLADPVPDVQSNAATALGEIGNRDAVPALIRATASSTTLAYFAVVALGNLGARKAVKPLLTVLEAPEEGLRRRAAVALGKLGDRRAAEPLLRHLREDPAEGVKAAAVQALGQLHYRPALPEAVAALRASSPSLRYAAAEALGEFKDPSVPPLLIAALADSEGVRNMAVASLGRLRAQVALEPLRRLEREVRDYQVRLAVRAAIRRIEQAPWRTTPDACPW
jgi:HEAT repeat protein